MTDIRIYNPYGDAYYSNKERTSTSFPITDKCERLAKLMGDDYVHLVFNLYDRITFDAFSFIVYNGQTFFLREQYVPTPNGTMQDGDSVSAPTYSYDVKFVSVANMLDKHVCYRHVVVNGDNGGEWYEPEININGTLETMYVIVLGAIKRAAEKYSSYYYGYMLSTLYNNGISIVNGVEKPSASVKLTQNTKLLTFNFSGDNIANVCTTIANNYTNDDKKDTEWWIEEKRVTRDGIGESSLILHFAKCQSDNNERAYSDYTYKDSGNYSFAHPYVTGGLKKVEYAQAWTGVTNVIVPYGSDRNMTYQAVKGIDSITNMQSTFGKRLRLKPNTTYRVYTKDGVADVTTDANGALRNDLVDTGIEEVKFFDDVYPQGHFQVSNVTIRNKRQDGQTVPEYTIEAIPVDKEGNVLENYDVYAGFYPITIEEGETLSVRFESGLLNGREFEIANKTRSELQNINGVETRVYSLAFTIVADGSIEDGTLIPSGNFIPRNGDKFALFNMKMPQEYIIEAEQELARRAYEELVKIQSTRPEVKCTTDPVNFNDNVVFGDVLRISSELFASEGNEFVSRVISYSHKLTKPNELQFSLASAVMQGTLSSMNDLIADVTHTTGGLEQRAINLSRRAWRDASEVAEMLDSITSEMMLVGNSKYQFAFTSSVECVTDGLHVGSGTIQHTQEPYIDYSNNGFWYVNEQVLNADEVGDALVAETPYYLYAKVADNQSPAIMVLSASDYNDNDAYLLFGVLSSEFEGERVFSRTNGFTAIAGGTITTEQIQDASRKLIIDFQHNPPRIIAREGAEILGEFKFLNGDNVKDAIDSYDYLKRALEQGTTEINGGLVMTNLLQLKNIDGNVTAGMSGITDDGVLLWGGGTYDDALAVRDGDLGTDLTTFISKAGTGKIGVFSIFKDNARISTADGTIIIDDNEGLSCQRPNESMPVVKVTPTELAALEDMRGQSVSNTYEMTLGTNNISGGNGETDSFFMQTDWRDSEPTYFGNNTRLTISGGIDVVTQSATGVRIWNEQDADDNNSPSFTSMRVEIYKGSSMVWSGYVNRASRNNPTYTTDSAGEYTIRYYGQVYCEKIENGVLSASAQVSGTLSVTYSYERLYKQTTIAYKGMFSYQGDDAYFYYKDGVGLDCQMGNYRLKLTRNGISMDGLPDSDPHEVGMLYKDGGSIKISNG